jgi:ubiquinone/menaquinone biosynthesis C-methylase UbiE
VKAAATPALDSAEIGAYWDGVASRFDGWLDRAGTGDSGHPPAEARAWELLWRRVIGPPPRRVLDVGCGTGSMAVLLASLGYEVIGVDGSAAMLSVARAKLDRTGLPVQLHEGRAESLPIAEGEVDAVVAKLVLWTLLEPEVAVAEWRRCTRTGGRVVAVDIAYDRLGPLDRARLHAVRSRRRAASAGYLGDPARAAQLPLWRAGAEAYRNVFRRAGLQRVLTEDLDGIARLERSRLPHTRRVWPQLTRRLVEGTVPAGDNERNDS